MVDVWLPYGKTEVCARIPTRNFLDVIEPKERSSVTDPQAEIDRALKEPIGTGRLGEIAGPSDKVVIVVDDVTRAAPTYLMLPRVLSELENVGVKDEDVTIIFACGIHRAVEQEEMKGLLGEAVLKKVNVINHNPQSEDLVYVGETTFKTKVYVNRIYAEADVKVLTGDIGLHFFAGYGGGRKSVLPGIAGAETIIHNHAMLLHPNAKTGVLEGNPVHEDMVEGAKLAKTDFILNLVTNSKKELVQAFAGDLEQAFYEGKKLVDEMYKVPIEQRADIVIVSPGGYPFDINLYQAYKGIDSALKAVKRGGVIILAAECSEGHGNELFYEWMRKFEDLKRLEREIKRRFVLGGHKAYYLRTALKKAKLVLVSIMPDYYAENIFEFKPARTINDALHNSFDAVRRNPKVLVMPYGNTTYPIIKTNE